MPSPQRRLPGLPLLFCALCARSHHHCRQRSNQGRDVSLGQRTGCFRRDPGQGGSPRPPLLIPLLVLLFACGPEIAGTGWPLVHAVVSAGERQGLANLYAAAGGLGWTGITTGWHNLDNSSADPCDPTAWTGVTCTGTTSITCVFQANEGIAYLRSRAR